MSLSRVVRNFTKMTPGSFHGEAKAATPAEWRPLGARWRIPAGTFRGESRAATPVGCPLTLGPISSPAVVACPEWPTTFDTTMGRWLTTSPIALPAGSDGDEVLLIGFVNSNVTMTGWTLVATHTMGSGVRYRVFKKTRTGGETTVTLGVTPGPIQRNNYSMVNVPAGYSAVATAIQTETLVPTWALSEAYDRGCPKFAVGHLCADIAVSWSGDFIEQETYITDPSENDLHRLYVADVASGTMDISASGTWDNAGIWAWLTVFYSAPA